MSEWLPLHARGKCFVFVCFFVNINCNICVGSSAKEESDSTENILSLYKVYIRHYVPLISREISFKANTCFRIAGAVEKLAKN